MDEIKVAFATQLSVALERITVTVVSASVKITVDITSETEQASVELKTQVEPQVATPEAATSFLAAGGATDVLVEAVEPVTVVSTADAVTSDGGTKDHPAKAGLIGGIIVTAIAAAIVFGLIAILLLRPTDKPAFTSRPSLPFRWASKSGSTSEVKIQKDEVNSSTDVKTAMALVKETVSNVNDDPRSSTAPDFDYM